VPSRLSPRGFLFCVRKMLKAGFIGAGTVGTALAVLLSRKGYKVTGVYSRSRTSAEKLAAEVSGCRVMNSGKQVVDTAELTFITTPDSAIEGVVSQVKWAKGRSAVHCSGADSTDILEHARKAGAVAGGGPPPQTFSRG